MARRLPLYQLQSKPGSPGFQILFRNGAAQPCSFFHRCRCADDLPDALRGISNSAPAGGAERNDFLASEIIGIQERVHDAGLPAPPDWVLQIEKSQLTFFSEKDTKPQYMVLVPFLGYYRQGISGR